MSNGIDNLPQANPTALSLQSYPPPITLFGILPSAISQFAHRRMGSATNIASAIGMESVIKK